MAVLLMKMAHNCKSNTSNVNANNSTEEVKPTIFHDFLGKGYASDSLPAERMSSGGHVRLESELMPSSVSPGASSGGGRGPISTTSDLGSGRQARNHFEGVPFYGPRSDFSGHEASNRVVGSKRSNSDLSFMGSSRDVILQMRQDSLESSHLMKIMRKVGREQPRQSHDEEAYFGKHPMRPTSASVVLQPTTSDRTDTNVSEWERAIPMNVGPGVRYPPRAGQVVPFQHQTPANRLKASNSGPSVISQAAADEGSRTGIKGSGILSSVNAISDRNPSGVLASGGKRKSGTCIIEPESSTPPKREGIAFANHQMTIFYGGQAHVFDNVHPNKADVIIALAGSNGGSWSTTYAPKSSLRSPFGENYMSSGGNDIGAASNFALSPAFHGKLLVAGNSSHGFGSGDRISVLPGDQYYFQNLV
ncbi:unnamed protein product [Ilex paraguariensis]|uniref:Protein TIFY n=1 Tax=Ilex paraguariensis TaxID=185542 RepID=A0ABC8UBR0_9AQUA